MLYQQDVNELDQTRHCMVRHGWDAYGPFKWVNIRTGDTSARRSSVSDFVNWDEPRIARIAATANCASARSRCRCERLVSGFVWSEAASCHGGRRAWVQRCPIVGCVFFAF